MGLRFPNLLHLSEETDRNGDRMLALFKILLRVDVKFNRKLSSSIARSRSSDSTGQLSQTEAEKLAEAVLTALEVVKSAIGFY